MATSACRILAILAAVLVFAAPTWAFELSVNSTVVLYDDFESPDVVGMAPVANVGTWTQAGGTVRSGPPNASQGGQYCSVPASTALRHTLASPVSAPGAIIKLDTMVYLPANAAGQDHWFQMVWFNTSGTIGGADNSPIHTSIAGGQLQYYNGTSGYVAAGAALQFGRWQHWIVEYTVGAGQWSVTIDGTKTIMGLNTRSADVGIGTISLFANGAAGGAWLFDASVSQTTNNNCADAYAIAPGTVAGSTAGATADGTSSCGNSNSSPDVWYKITAPATGLLKLDTCGSAFDTVLSVHAGTCPGTSATQLGCSDDCGGTPCGGTASCLEVPVTLGTEYLIRVAGKNGASGDFTLNVAVVPDCPNLPFPQHFDTTAVGSPACWFTGTRWFSVNPGAVVAVTDSDSNSPPHSLKVTGTGDAMMTWRDYKGLSSNGVDPITVSFDFKVDTFEDNIAISPFAFNGSLWGTAGTPSADPYGWPVNTNYQPDGTFTYIDDLAGTVTLFAKSRADLNGQWIRWTGTVYPATRKVDVAVEVLTGPAAGTSGGAVGRDFQYAVAQDYYGQAMDELRGSVFFTGAGSSFGDDDAFLIDNYDVRPGAATLTAPVNDACANALTATSGRVYGRTVGATSDGSASCGDTAGSPDVWYRYTPSCTGNLLIKSCGSGFGFAVSVHQDSCPGTAGKELASGCSAGCGSSLCNAFQPCLSVPVAEGTTYLIRVAGANGTSGFFGLELACASIATNDNCSAAKEVGEGTFTGSTLLATNDGDATCGSSATSPDVWFKYTAGCTGKASINTTGSSFDTVLSVYSGACPAGLQNELACNDDSGGAQSSLTLAVTQGTAYLIRLAGKNDASGEYTLHISCSDPCPNPALPQEFELDAAGSPACWTAGPRFFGVTDGMAAVTEADASSGQHSLVVAAPGIQPHAWRDYGGKSSDGVRLVTVRLDMKVVGFAENVTITPFMFNAALFGSAGTPHPDGLGWPVDTKYSPSGAFIYYEDGTPITILDVARADVNGQWFRYTATIDTSTRLTDVSVQVLTGPAAGQSGSVTGKQVQYQAGADYYGAAMDELRGSGFFTQADMGGGDQILVDNFNVVIGAACPKPFADTDGDGDVDQVDFAQFQRCLTTATIGILPGCACFDRDGGGQGDGDIDTADFEKFMSCASGPAVHANPDCGN